MNTPTVLELFAGMGGAALGLHRAGWSHLSCIDKMPAAVATLRAAGLPGLEADLAKMDWSRSRWGGVVDLLWASPPCQPGSVAGKRRGAADSRDGWPMTFRAIDALQPTWVLAENVLGWTRHEKDCGKGAGTESCVGCYWETRILPQMQERFAAVSTWRLDAADFGTPQHRRRVILCAGPEHVAPPLPTHGGVGRPPWVSMGKAIGRTLLDPADRARRHCYTDDGTYGRACSEPWRLDAPAPTVTTMEEKGTRAHAPVWSFNGGPDRASDATFLAVGVRRITLAEGLALQGFPLNWPLRGSIHERYVQVGNAVPPQLAEAVARQILHAC